MALNNCSIDSQQVTVTKGQALGSTASQVLTITPNAGYVVAADDFSKENPPAGISTITLADTGTPYADDNKVTVTCDLDNSYVANNSTDFIIDIDGDAKDKKCREFTVAGTHDATVSNATPSTYSGTAYSGSNLPNPTEPYPILFRKEFNATAGNYFATPPTATVSTGTASNYVIDIIDTNEQSYFGYLTGREFVVRYKFPETFVTGDNIDFVANAIAKPTDQNTQAIIRSLVMNDDAILKQGEQRTLTIYGTSSANFELEVKRASDNFTYDFATESDTKFTNSATKLDNVGIGSDGKHEVFIEFPPITSGTETYNIKVTAESGTTLSTSINNHNNANPNIALTQQDDVTITLTTINGSNVTGRTTDSITGGYLENVGTADGYVDQKTASFTVTGSQALYVARQPIFPDDFSNVDASGSSFFITDPTITGSGTTTLTIASSTNGFTVTGFPSTDITSNLNLANIISQPPVASNATFAGNEDQALSIDLSSHVSNPQGNTLTYSVVADNTSSNGTLGSINASTGAITYTPAANNNTNVNFTWKVNDGVQDSNTATATLNIAAVADAPTDITMSSQSIDENNSINDVIGAFSSVDPDGSGSYTYTLVSGTGSTDNSSFNISGSNLRASEAFDYETKNSYSIRVRSTDADGSGHFEKQFTITINDVAETPSGARWEITTYLANGSQSGIHYVSATQYCNGSNLAAMPVGCFQVNHWIRYSTVAGGCGTSFGRAKITDQTVNNGEITAYISGDKHYSSMNDSHNDTGGTNC